MTANSYAAVAAGPFAETGTGCHRAQGHSEVCLTRACFHFLPTQMRGGHASHADAVTQVCWRS